MASAPDAALVGGMDTASEPTNVVEAVWRSAYAEMDRQTGMFPSDWSCKACGKTLNADGGHPAELYAGTYTGLCYGCERSEGFVVSTDPLDGAITWSYPPSTPSWRRDRETKIAYVDCPDCDGTGFQWKYTSGRGRIRSHCAACSDRYFGHSLRRWRSERSGALPRHAEAVYQARLVAATGLPKRTGKKRMAAACLAVHNSPEGKEIADEILGRYRRIQARFDALAAARFDEAIAARQGQADALCRAPVVKNAG